MIKFRINCIFLTVFLLFIFFLIFPKPSLAQTATHITECEESVSIGTYGDVCTRWVVTKYGAVCVRFGTQYNCGASWYEYRSENTKCGTKILKRSCQSNCGPQVPVPGSCQSCGTCDNNNTTAYPSCTNCGPCQVTCGPPETYKQCAIWQKSKRACETTKWGTIEPECQCEGECLDTPQNDRYYDNPTYSDQPNENTGNENIKLPVKLDWDDVRGWKQKGGPQSYIVKIENTIKGIYSKILGASEYNYQQDEDAGACFLESNTSYNWRAKACCTVDGQNCGPESDWTLTTNIAPEPVSPADPDWTGEEGKANAETPIALDWCGVKDANSLLLKIYILQGENKICHPNLLTIKDGKESCDSLILRKKRRDINEPEKTLFSDFLDENLSLFTQDTAYLWEVATCLDDNGLDCKDFSQQWIFTTQQKHLPEVSLVSPADDPTGQKPVGFPLTLDWGQANGINSWWYKIGAVKELTKSSQSRSFDYPELSLNTYYQWQVFSCLDYDGKQCQDTWSQTYTFKTTGQPPTLAYPASGTNGIPIPVNFDWEDVGGAKSYIVKIQGNGLNVEKILTESNFSIDFPEFPIKQETNYSWQVKTCARDNGQVCGSYSSSQNFRTFRISAPQNPAYPQNRGELFTGDRFLSWEKVVGAKAYQYQIKYLALGSKESDQTCSTLTGTELFPEPQKTIANSGFAELICLGGYQWQVRSCLDENCRETSDWSNPWAFSFLEGGTGQGGLVPCGRATNNDKTPWNEREPCQIKHLFLSIKIILDFMLLRLMPIILVLLTIATGVVFYTSFGKAFTLAQVISLWKAAGIGLGLIFFAWALVNLFLGLVGYNVGIFGNWYDINL